jgi:hypothetical protein
MGKMTKAMKVSCAARGARRAARGAELLSVCGD